MKLYEIVMFDGSPMFINLEDISTIQPLIKEEKALYQTATITMKTGKSFDIIVDSITPAFQHSGIEVMSLSREAPKHPSPADNPDAVNVDEVL